MISVPHPAKYSQQLRPLLREWVVGHEPVLDPMAGIGTLGVDGMIHSELEPEWARQCPTPAVVADATQMPYRSGSIGAVVTSPTYGNRMADHHEAKDTCKKCAGVGCVPCRFRGLTLRHTYRHYLERRLHPRNTGQMQWGPQYREMHWAIYAEVWRVLRPGGVFVLNVSDHVRRRRVERVANWHRNTLIVIGFELEEHATVATPRQGHGANGTLRVDGEDVFRFRRPGMSGFTP